MSSLASITIRDRHVGADRILVLRQVGVGDDRFAHLHVSFLVFADLVVATTEADGVGVVISFFLDVAAGGDETDFTVLMPDR
ncbi:hypothetical protein [Pseudomonas syringae]|uniref:hypothetical protein n=1 Tax=Pseudomonas syringae TaxID=317 RepID=UPI001268A53A|nr:hypothetical protein [Pseudomonas syringae]